MIGQHHVLFIRQLRQKAQDFARNQTFTEEHRRNCAQEAKLFVQIENHLMEHITEEKKDG